MRTCPICGHKGHRKAMACHNCRSAIAHHAGKRYAIYLVLAADAMRGIVGAP